MGKNHKISVAKFAEVDSSTEDSMQNELSDFPKENFSCHPKKGFNKGKNVLAFLLSLFLVL